ncbi:MAG: sugar phosphate isomerase/epimerase family protein [bacterium]|jgi:sugar phosphate isomerase/epimerase
MSNDLRNSMRVGIVHFMLYPATSSGNGPILETIREIAQDEFFDVIELTHIEDSALRKKATEIVSEAGLQLAYATQPLVLGQKLNLHSRDSEERQKALRVMFSGLEEAVEMEAVGFATMSGTIPAQDAIEEETKLFIDSLNQICKRGQELNPAMNIVVETFDNVPFGKNCLVGPTAEAVKLAREVQKDYPNFGLMLDLSHLPLLEESSTTAIQTAAPVLRHAHIGNCVMTNPENPYYGDNHPPFGYPDSENDLEELIEYLLALRDVGFLNDQNPPIVTIEAKPLNDEMRPAVIGNIKRTLNRAIRRINAM